MLEDSRTSKREALETAAQSKRELDELARELDDLKTDHKTALLDNDDVSGSLIEYIVSSSAD